MQEAAPIRPGPQWRFTAWAAASSARCSPLPGLIDLLSLPAGPRSTATKHMAINLTVVALYLINFWIRLQAPGSPGKLVWLSLIAIGLLVISGWLGGKMVYEHGIAVSTPADPQRR